MEHIMKTQRGQIVLLLDYLDPHIPGGDAHRIVQQAVYHVVAGRNIDLQHGHLPHLFAAATRGTVGRGAHRWVQRFRHHDADSAAVVHTDSGGAVAVLRHGPLERLF